MAVTGIMSPKININGTDRQSLVMARIAAREAIWKAVEALSELRPHGRDYQGYPDDYKRDLEIHQARQAMLNKLYNDLELEAEEIIGE